MARQNLDKDTRKQIMAARKMMEDVERADGNEAETRRRVERIFESVMGYDAFKHISREHAVRGAGETEHCDFAIQLDHGEKASPVIMVELKRVAVDLATKHLKQVSSYAINAGCEWILLTNGRDWRLYHVSFGQPPQTKRLEAWNLLHDDPAVLAEKFNLISYRNIKKGGLDQLWEKANVLTPRNVLRAIVSEDSIKFLRRKLKKSTGVLVSPEDVVGAIRRLLNEAAGAEMEGVKISLPEQKTRRTKTSKSAKKQQPEGQVTESTTDDDKSNMEADVPPPSAQ